MHPGSLASSFWLEPVPFGVMAFVSLLGLVHPLGAVPCFERWGAARSESERARLALRAGGFATVALLAAAIVGTMLFKVVGLRWPGVAGLGALNVFLGGMELSRGARTAQLREAAVSPIEPKRDDPARAPLGFPVLAGPAALLHVVVLLSVSPAWRLVWPVLVAIAGVGGASAWTAARATSARGPGTPIVRLAASRVLAVLLMPVALRLLAHGLLNADLMPLGGSAP